VVDLSKRGGPLDPQRHPYIIAEIGQNHQGDVYTAIRLCAAALASGADAVKFQARDAAAEYHPAQLARPHPRPEHAFGPTYGDHRACLDLDFAELRHIRERIRFNQWPLDFGVTPCHMRCVEPLIEMDLDFFKIASKDCGNIDLIMEVATSTSLPLMVSTGGATDNEKDCAADWADVLLHCNRVYPTPLDNVDLLQVLSLKSKYNQPVGWSDHTGTTSLGGAAVALGASVFESHITFSQQQRGTDHAASLTPDLFCAWSRNIRASWRSIYGVQMPNNDKMVGHAN